MAKILAGIGSGLTIAALFRTSFEAFDIFQTSYNQETDFQKLSLRLDIEKCRLYLWGESTNLTNVTGTHQQQSYLYPQFPQTVQHILRNLTKLFRDAELVKGRYDPKQNPRITHPEVPGLTTDELNTIGAIIKQNVSWVVYDRHRFSSLIKEIRDLITKLRDITNSPVLLQGVDERAKQSLSEVSDTEALAFVSGVCSVDHPDIQRIRQQRPLLWSRVVSSRDNRSRRDNQSRDESQYSDDSQADSDVTRWPGLERFRYGNLRL